MKIFVITDTKYPNNDAVTTRTALVCKIFAENGHSVRVYSRTEKPDGEYEGLPYFSLRGNSNGKIGKICDYFFDFTQKFLAIVEKERPDTIVFHTIPTNLLKKLIKLKSKYGFDLINDCVEWYSKEQMVPTVISRIQYYTRDMWMRKILPGKVRVIAISQYLKEYFDSNNTPCEYLPSICDTQKVLFNKTVDENKITIVYAGSPGKKDLFGSVVRAIKMLTDEERKKLELNIIGATPMQIAENAECTVNELNALDDSIHFLPRMSHEEVLQQLEKADFTILIRPEHLRYAKAGFPTKVPESLSAGTPIICNLTSDLAMYLTDGVNSIISSGPDATSVCEAFKKAILLNGEQRRKMYANARETAEEKFDYRLYKDKINAFLEGKRDI